MKMYFLVYHVQPRPDLEDADDVGGAYVSCWIEADSLKQAEQIAKQEIGDLRWDILEKDDSFEIDPKTYTPDSDGFEFYQQALIDKIVLRIHTYPIEE
jgi:hypothetical protein